MRSNPGLCLLLILSTAACTEEDPYQPDRLAVAREHAERIRGLPFLREVEVRRITRREYEAEQRQGLMEQDPAELERFIDLYARLGFFRLDLDYAAAAPASWNAAATYLEDRITVIGDGDASISLLVHEYVHALQDQHFDFTVDDDVDTDAFYAWRAMTEGDAALAEHLIDEKLGRLDWQGIMADEERWTESMLEGTSPETKPAIFQRYGAFVYRRGLIYHAHTLTGATPESPVATHPPARYTTIDDSIGDGRPLTTLHVITLGEERGAPTFGGASLPPAVAEHLEVVSEDRLGAWLIQLLFLPVEAELADLDAEALALASRGDHALLVRDRVTGSRGVVWVSLWGDAAEATRAATAMTSLQGRLADGENFQVEHEGTVLLFMRNIAPAHAAAVRDHVFSGTPASPSRRSRVGSPLPRWPHE